MKWNIKINAKQDTGLDAAIKARYDFWWVWEVWDNEEGLMKSLRKHFIKDKKVRCPQPPQGKIKSGYTVPQSHNQTVGRKKKDEKKKKPERSGESS